MPDDRKRRDSAADRAIELVCFLQGVVLGMISATDDEVTIALKQLDEYLPDATPTREAIN